MATYKITSPAMSPNFTHGFNGEVIQFKDGRVEVPDDGPKDKHLAARSWCKRLDTRPRVYKFGGRGKKKKDK